MKVICEANNTILKLLVPFYKSADNNRLINFCIQTNVNEGVLLFNLLTREMILLTNEEFKNQDQIAYLKEHWFYVPDQTNEKEYVDILRSLLNKSNNKNNAITTYTIFPTTDCNARCFYCFELGRSRIPMTIETAAKTVQFIKDHSCNNKITLHWFGGEPLLNIEVIDYICKALEKDEIEFTSLMTSNGYLFDENTIKKAVDTWRLKKVQITLDGTEQIYNKTKAYIYKNTNPYQTVINNIENLSSAGVRVSIRLNMDLYNAEDLLNLCDILAQKFYLYKNISVYAHHIFDNKIPMAQMHTDEEWAIRDELMQQIEQKLISAGLLSKQSISPKIKTNHCKADSDSAVTILPDGSIGVCEQKTESDFIGHIDDSIFNNTVIKEWKKTMDPISECATCFAYPECIKLKNCINDRECHKRFREEYMRNTIQKMINEYNKH